MQETLTHLISPAEVKSLARLVSKQIPDDRIQPLIVEAEQIDIKNSIGENMYLTLINYVNRCGPSDHRLDDLLNGKIYTTDRCGEQRMHQFQGIRTALAYFVYARLVKQGDISVTSAGTVNKMLDYSVRPDTSAKKQEATDTYAVAENYMNGCIEYLCENSDLYPEWKSKQIKATRSTIFTKIGD